ncbi:MAG: tRNA (guanosine(37)-N1)-methyltransferase TrmD [Acidobacteriales bacterium]|nr:tRNA (guanosine(37)-N1)-methyltransferase TrmD [Terriglobales bacterium]
MQFDLITIFPEFFRGPLDHGIVRRAQEAKLVKIGVHDLRAFTHDRHKTVDDRPFGGGEGMVLKPEPIFECLESLGVVEKATRDTKRETVILLSAQGRMFDQDMASELAQRERLVLLCGRYEGVDERVSEFLADREVSVGDFVLSGGELGAALIVDAVTRLLPGALGNEASARQESFTAREAAPAVGVPSSTCGSGGLLDYPHYTRPAEFRGMAVPEILSSGDHAQIRRWRREKALEKTLRNRPDLLEQVELSEEDKNCIARIRAKKN